jgi:hypothetical protein
VVVHGPEVPPTELRGRIQLWLRSTPINRIVLVTHAWSALASLIPMSNDRLVVLDHHPLDWELLGALRPPVPRAPFSG